MSRMTYPCPGCKADRHVDELDDHTGLCRACRGRSCVVCGVAIAGYSSRKTCSTRCRVALHRHGPGYKLAPRARLARVENEIRSLLQETTSAEPMLRKVLAEHEAKNVPPVEEW